VNCEWASVITDKIVDKKEVASSLPPGFRTEGEDWDFPPPEFPKINTEY